MPEFTPLTAMLHISRWQIRGPLKNLLMMPLNYSKDSLKLLARPGLCKIKVIQASDAKDRHLT